MIHSEGVRAADWQSITSSFTRSLAPAGLDLIAPSNLQWYAKVVPEQLRISYDHGVNKGSSLAVIIGNSLSIWQPFIADLASNKSSVTSSSPETSDIPAHPLNNYVARRVSRAVEQAWVQFQKENESMISAGRLASPDIYYSHETAPGRLVAIQRMAHAAGAAFLSDTCHLCIHPTFGPWFSLRAVAIFDVLGPEVQPPPMASPLSFELEQRLQQLVHEASQQMQSSSIDGLGDWRRWLAARDAIAPAHPFRYSEDQLEYHYTVNRDVLVRAMKERQ
eukprot:jgi/Chlat1/75/Chrsp1S03032